LTTEISSGESVWQYPRPPRLETTARHLRIEHAGLVLAESIHAFRVLETSHPPVYYIPPQDVEMEYLRPSRRAGSSCEFKGIASYWTLDLSRGAERTAAGKGSLVVLDVAWSYENPLPAYAALRGHLAFYASRVDACYVDGERVTAQPGDFYGGWITSEIQGPFKGAPGTLDW
jgi:uncharacterized protein (DUF427 family)